MLIIAEIILFTCGILTIGVGMPWAAYFIAKGLFLDDENE